jgi:hypothetical protein
MKTYKAGKGNPGQCRALPARAGIDDLIAGDHAPERPESNPGYRLPLEPDTVFAPDKPTETAP